MFKNWFWYLLTLWYWTSYLISLSFSSLCLMVFKFFPFEAAWYGRSISVSSGIRVNQIINFLIIYPLTTQILYLYHVGNRAIPNSQSFGEEYVNQCTWGQLLRCLGKGRPSINVTSPSVPTCFSSLTRFFLWFGHCAANWKLGAVARICSRHTKCRAILTIKNSSPISFMCCYWAVFLLPFHQPLVIVWELFTFWYVNVYHTTWRSKMLIFILIVITF